MPSWFALTTETGDAVEGRAEVRAASGPGKTVASLRIWVAVNEVEVAEAKPGSEFPADCPERHINSDGSFCLGYGAGEAVYDLDDAIVWWGLLEEFLRLQRVAARTRRWPARKAIAHGPAGPHQVRALEAARELGLEEDYYEMLEGEPKWFSGRFPRHSANGDRLLNGRLPCPMECLRGGRAILRRDCPRERLVAQLLSEERKRRAAERAFVRATAVLELKCCGAMKDCPRARLAQC